MTYSAPLPNTGVILPVPGSGQAWEVAVFNANFTGVDNAIGADRDRLDDLEAKLVNNPLIPAGSSAARDGFYGTPASASARVALANSAPRWFNTDKGYQERYFAPVSDNAAPGYNTLYARGAGGWSPEGSGLVPVNWNVPSTLSGTTGFKADVNGNMLVLTGVTQAAFTNLFTADFAEYELHWNLSTNVASSPLLRVATAGVPDQGAAVYTNEWLAVGSAAVAASTTSTNAARLYKDAVSTAWSGRTRIIDPMDAARVTQFITDSHRTSGITIANSVHNTVGARDGISIVQETAAFLSGYVQLFGLAGGHN